MEHAYEIYTASGSTVKNYPASDDRSTIEAGLINGLGSETWYRLRYHLCGNSVQSPCQPWEDVKEKGTLPVEEGELT